MRDEVNDGRDALDMVLTWIADEAKVSFLHEGHNCFELFTQRNLPRFNEVFSRDFWELTKDTLEAAARLHGRLTTEFTYKKKGNAKEADLDAFIDAGRIVRQNCGLTIKEKIARITGKPAELDADGMPRGMWCSWPS
jgi:hypothetical protein